MFMTNSNDNSGELLGPGAAAPLEPRAKTGHGSRES